MKDVLFSFINFIFPYKCTLCRQILNEKAILCPECWKKIEFITEPCCTICSSPFQFDFNIPKHLMICGQCQQNKPFFDQSICIFKYTDYSKYLIFKLKYNDKLHLAKYFNDLLNIKLQQFVKSQKYHIITSVPLHKKRLRQRLYNQSSLIAKKLSDANAIVFIPDLLFRVKYEKSQTLLTKKMRIKNITGSFIINPKYKSYIKNKSIVLVDDVITTGSTINECSKVLKKNHCNTILTATIAKSVI